MATIDFEHHMPCGLDHSSLFAWLVEAVRDTDLVEVWPRHLNRVRIPRLEEGESFEAEYRLPLRSITRPYRVAEVVPDEGFSYAPGPGHPFQGLVHVRVKKRDRGSALAWFGSYDAPSWRPERAFFRLYFEPRFFESLRRGLASL